MKKIVALAATIAVTGALAPAASAQERTIQQSGHGQILPSTTLADANITIECTARSIADTASVSIRTCALQSRTGQRWYAPALSFPGPFATTGRLFTVPATSGPWKVCVQSDAIWTDASMYTAPEQCS